MSRHLSRDLAFKILFQADVGHNPWQQVLAYTCNEYKFPESSRLFLEQLVKGTIRHLKEIDAEITKYSEDWKLERMANTDRNILRMAIFEIKYLEEIPPGVTVNEAVELAKKYGDEESGKFVNGILGNLVRNLEDNHQSEPIPKE
jgi:N utilization substance protein B